MQVLSYRQYSADNGIAAYFRYNTAKFLQPALAGHWCIQHFVLRRGCKFPRLASEVAVL